MREPTPEKREPTPEKQVQEVLRAVTRDGCHGVKYQSESTDLIYEKLIFRDARTDPR